ncbi:MAG TPA: GDSL-type esterase/lipase family protein [Lacunisphaera sp.]|jgi:lysophospholipase L1-like esterase|nr:GDSL-type esterase/lipase family protein [Lacunisphaera sp.]
MNIPRLLLFLLGAGSAAAPLPAAETVIVAFGDSTTAARPPLSVYAELLPPRLAAELGVTVKIINAGVRGNTTEHARQRLAADVLAKQPDLVVIQFGINDSAMDVWKDPPVTHTRVTKETYRKNLEYFVAEIRRQHGQVMFMTPNPKQWSEKMRELYGKPPYQVDDPDGFNLNLRPFAEEMRQVAKELEVPMLDVMAAYDAHHRANPENSLLSDGIHPNQAGQQLVADLLLEFLREHSWLLEVKSAKK